MENQPIIVERIYNAPINKVWKAITDKTEMKKWYFDLEDFRAEVGFEFEFEGGTDENKYLHKCKVVQVVPGNKISYSWRYDGYPGNTLVTFELFEEKDQNGKPVTKLKLTHEGLETLPSSNSDFRKDNFVQGWNALTGESLTNYLENNK